MAEALAPQSRDDRQAGIDRVSLAGRILTPEQVTLLKNTVCRDATDDELRMFVGVCGRTGLDPFTKQIHYVKRWDSALKAMVGAIQVGIDGYRLIAARTGKYGGQDAPEWCSEDGQWRDVWLADEPPAAARVRVYHLDFPDRPVVGIARWKAFVQTRKDGTERVPNAIWTQYDAEQLAKCAEAMALRKAFPNELSATQTEEELPAAAAMLERDARATRGLRGVEKAAAKDVSEAVEELVDSIASELEVPPVEAEPELVISDKEFEAACAKAKSVLNWNCLKKPSDGDVTWFVCAPALAKLDGAGVGSIKWKDGDVRVMHDSYVASLYAILREAITARVAAA